MPNPPPPARSYAAWRVPVAISGVVLLLVVGLGLFVASDLHARERRGVAHATLRDESAALRRDRHDVQLERAGLTSVIDQLTLVGGSLASTSQQRDALQTQLASTQTQLEQTRNALTGVTTRLAEQVVGIDAVSQCVKGVSRALNQLSVGDNAGALVSLQAASGSCQSAQQSGASG
ncbi:MAG: hypothetical protein JWL73_276 [Actinomycetia bacterium]|nr:hypothetical protein [Actinomycetes bacterium]